MLQRRHIVGDLDHVVERHAGRLVELEQQQVGERRLRAFYLAGEHGFAPHIGIEKEIGLWQQRRNGVEPTAGEQRPLQPPLAGRSEQERRARRQRMGNESAHSLPGSGCQPIFAGETSFQTRLLSEPVHVLIHARVNSPVHYLRFLCFV